MLQRGVPQSANFHLLFVGRVGWMVDDVTRQLKAGDRDQYAAMHLEGVSDLELETLYRDCVFRVYPSHYEGFDLPIIEAFTRGKAVIASTGGAVPETVGGLSPCLDPLDVDAWTAADGGVRGMGGASPQGLSAAAMAAGCEQIMSAAVALA